MGYLFNETVDLIIPNFEEQLNTFSEGEFQKNHGLVIEVASIHAGATANFNAYSEAELTKSVNSWLEPYPKPIIMNHDQFSEPIGRVMGAKMDAENDGTPYLRLQAAILDPEAIKRVADGRYLTGSVGGKADEAVCTICNTDWAAPKEGRGLPCVHQRGKVYNGKVAMIDMRGIGFKEYSFVNMPADGGSSIRKVGESELDESWTKPARFFVLDMGKENIVEFQESEESLDILDGLRKKDALPLYMGLKGAFIVAQAMYEDEKQENSIKDSVNMDKPDTNTDSDNETVEENLMSIEDTPSVTEDEDILAVAEGLSDDLAATSDVETAEEAETEQESQEAEAAEESDETEEAEVEEAEEEVEEGERPEGQEKPHDKDVDPDTSEGADKSRENDETDPEVSETSEEEAELNTEENDIEPHADELESEIATLTEENTKLRDRVAKLEAALHKGLAERVVDAKISLGLVEVTDRNSEIEEHAVRTASSLADTMRDLAKMEPGTTRASVDGLEMNQEVAAVGEESAPIVDEDGEDLEEKEVNPLEDAENFFYEVLSGSRKA